MLLEEETQFMYVAVIQEVSMFTALPPLYIPSLHHMLNHLHTNPSTPKSQLLPPQKKTTAHNRRQASIKLQNLPSP